MGRAARCDVEGGWYHVVNRGAARNTIFFDDRDRVEFERLLGDVHDRFGIVVHSYCWMTNHYHLVLECPTGDLTRAMHRLGSLYVRHVNDRQGRDGPLFRDRFFAKPVRTDPYLQTLVRYVHRNPVSIVGESHLESYPWSSLRAYLGHRRPPRWMSTDTVLELVGGRRDFERLVMSPESGAVQAPVAADGPAVIGLIELIVDERRDDLRGKRPLRSVAVSMLDRVGDDLRGQLEEQLGFSSREAAAMARLRARREIQDHPVMNEIAESVLRLVA